jgi:hypothetical protein
MERGAALIEIVNQVISEAKSLSTHLRRTVTVSCERT